VALGQTETACTPNSAMQGVTNCQVALALKVFGEDGRIVDTQRLSEIGPGFSEQDAVARGVELLVERSGARILGGAPSTCLVMREMTCATGLGTQIVTPRQRRR
jgi:hypothetical protein